VTFEYVEWFCGKRNFRRRREQSLSVFFYFLFYVEGAFCAERCVRVSVDAALETLTCGMLMA